MMLNGRVVGGHFVNAPVSPARFGSDLVVQSGLKWRALSPKNVASWREVAVEASGGFLSAVGGAAAGAVLPVAIRKAASAAVGTAIEKTVGSSHTVRVDWTDGKQSLLRLPEKMFTHFSVLLEDLRAEPVTAIEAPPTPAPSAEPPSVSEQAFAFASTLLDGDVSRQLEKLAALRDKGILTESEFTAKKTELLARM